MASTIHQRVDGTFYRKDFKIGRNKLPPEEKLSKRVIGSVTESMRSEVDSWIARGWKESLIIQLALREWLDRQKSVQYTA